VSMQVGVHADTSWHFTSLNISSRKLSHVTSTYQYAHRILQVMFCSRNFASKSR
jgi:hypothetical protein